MHYIDKRVDSSFKEIKALVRDLDTKMAMFEKNVNQKLTRFESNFNVF